MLGHTTRTLFFRDALHMGTRILGGAFSDLNLLLRAKGYKDACEVGVCMRKELRGMGFWFVGD